MKTADILIYLLGLFGLILFVFGVWLIRNRKDIEPKARHEYRTRNAIIFGNYNPQRIWELWGPHSLKPLTYFSMVAGLVCILIFISSLF
jgi:hypothetical protein